MTEFSADSARAAAAEVAVPMSAAEPWQALAEADGLLDYCSAWLGVHCSQTRGVRAALVVIEDADQAFVPAAVWPEPATDVTHLGEAARACLTAQAGQALDAGDDSGHVYLGYPILVDGRPCAAVVLDLVAPDPGAVQEAQRALHWASGRLEVEFQKRALDEALALGGRAEVALDAAALFGEHPGLEAPAMALVNELSVHLDCERVALGMVRGDRVRLLALSNAAWFEARGDFVTALETAMDEAVDQRRSVVHPALPAADDGPGAAIAVAHRDLAGEAAACSVVLAVRGREIGAITCVRREGVDRDTVRVLEAVAALVAPHLESRREAGRWLSGRLPQSLRRAARSLRDPRRPGFQAIVLLVLAAVAALATLESEYRVAADAIIEGEVQRAVVAPFDGFVASAAVRAGQQVAAGQALAVLDDRDLRLERQKWLSEREQAERKYRDALAKHEATNARILSAQLAEAEAQLTLAEEKLLRTVLVAPFDGLVVSGDLSQSLGSPVEKGEVLFELAPLDAYRVILKVEEQDIRGIEPGQQGQLMLAGSVGEALPFVVGNVSVASAEEGRNVFRVEARLAQAAPTLRPGMQGV
ncbi:MAG: HlyD family efflux transporter periplasmic adaptor subunit, partial [Gammaproteobacteria bacterium]